jgi:hypothetical protein
MKVNFGASEGMFHFRTVGDHVINLPASRPRMEAM